MAKVEQNSVSVRPPFQSDAATWRSFRKFVSALEKIDPADQGADAAIELIRRRALVEEVSPLHQAGFRVVVSVLCDLCLQGWSVRLNRRSVDLVRPVALLEPGLERRRIRRMHAVNRDVQLLKQSVRDFVRSLERKRLGPNRDWVSIFSLMRDGRELAGKLRQLNDLPSDEAKVEACRTIIRPYLQLVAADQQCEHTGIPLGEIWRYFRHTWATEYQTVPGRNLMLLVRDAAAPYHPVLGVAALASPVVHLALRDEWIGWAPQQFISELRRNPSVRWAKWVTTKLEKLISEIFVEDLIQDGVTSDADISTPSEESIARLEEEASRARERHHLHPTKAIHKTPTKDVRDHEWRRRAETHLFRFKRCTALAELLRARLRLKDAGFTIPTKETLSRLLSTGEGRQAVETVRKHVKAIHIGNDVLDITVCGAVAPYAEILGGKLVAMLLTSPEIVRLYSQRYGKAISIIASSMAGRRVARRPQLAALTTTSLYGAEPNQYTRVSVPVSSVGGGGEDAITYKKLGLTRGQGSYHFSSTTVDLIETFLAQSANSRSVNSIFGEGVSPRLRKIRGGLDACGFPTDEVLTHGSPRVIYGVSLAKNLREVLLEGSKRVEYLIHPNCGTEATTCISDFWIRRWLIGRIAKGHVPDRVERHTLVSPVEHGARICLPRIFDEEPLFYHQS